MTRYATITGVGSYLPPRLVPNSWFESIVDTNDEWIRDRTGIEARHFADDGVSTSDLALEASRKALEAAGVEPQQIDMIVVATITGDTVFPATAVWLQEKLGVPCPSFDLNAACAGFSYGLSTANAFITSGMAETILVMGAEIFSRIIDFTDRGTCVLFGDGAGAALVQASDAPGFEGAVLGADGSAAEILWMPAGGTRTPPSHATVDANDHTVRMPNGREVFKRAVTEMASACRELLEKTSLTIEDIDVLIPHQANARIMSPSWTGWGSTLRRPSWTWRRWATHRGLDPDRAGPCVARGADRPRRPGAVHLVRRGPDVGGHGGALDHDAEPSA